MRQTFVGQEFRNEHDKKRSQEKKVGYETSITITFPQTFAQESDGLPNKKEKSGKEKSTNKGIEYRIGGIVMAPILVSPEIVFEEREGKCFGDGARDIAVIEFRVEDRDVSGTRSKIIRVSNKKFVEHRRGSDESTQDKHESVLPKPFIKFLVG